MVYRVFSQASPADEAGEARLVRIAHAHFRAALSVRTRHIRGTTDSERREQLTVGLTQGGQTTEHTITRRAATPGDWSEADTAAARGRAGGMDDLARRCRWLWEVDEGEDARATLMLCAILAATELGPVLPPDGATLYGVRGARERADRIG